MLRAAVRLYQTQAMGPLGSAVLLLSSPAYQRLHLLRSEMFVTFSRSACADRTIHLPWPFGQYPQRTITFSEVLMFNLVCRRTVPLGTACLLLSAFGVTLPVVAQTESAQQFSSGTTASATTGLPQYATLTATPNTITATRVPVLLANGKTTYVDLTVDLTFTEEPSGTLTVTSAVHSAISPNLITSNFKAGNYMAPSTDFGGAGLITVSGGGATAGGATEWNLAVSPGASGCMFPVTANWYVGPIASSPYASRIRAAKVTSTAWSYGVGDSSCGWYGNSLLGFSQVGNTITIVDFTNNQGDSSTPIDSITYTLKQVQ